MKPNAALTPTSAAAINQLVTYSLPGLKSENVSIVDSNGGQWRELGQTNQDAQTSANLKHKTEFENRLKDKAEQMLAKALGKNRVMVSVTADLDFKREKVRRNSIIPDEKGIEKEMQRESKSTGGTTGGVTGAASNIRQASGGGSRGGGTASETVTQAETKFSQQVRDTDDLNIPIQRISIAALVDLSPTPAAEGQDAPKAMTAKEVEDIIKGATGFVETRDQLKITNTVIPGTTLPNMDADDETASIQRLSAYVSLARNISLAVALVMALSLIPLLLLRRRAKLTAAAATAAATAATQQEQRHQERIQRLVDLARTDPDRAAAVFGLMAGTPAA
jgi:flagellar M-ring protein FliF